MNEARSSGVEQESSVRDQPSLSLPKAGGAIRGMGEKFTTNPVTGTASLSVPISLTEAREGGTPRLTLSYDSGAGNGPFGLGWSLEAPSISRRTDKGVPRYLDDDVFQLSGAEDLVPAIFPAPHRDGRFDVVAYRPRTEGLFARIERLRDDVTGEIRWCVVSKDNVKSVFGREESSRVSDPDDPSRVFRWLVDETVDDRGNVIAYEYKADGANRYLKRIRYGNRVAGGEFCFEVVFDYHDHDEVPTSDDTVEWTTRPDPFSTRRPGFEVRTERLCRRVLMFHRIPELGAGPVLVASTDFGYEPDPATTKLSSVTQFGYIKVGDGYQSKHLPPLDFGYSPRAVAGEIRPILSGPGGDPVRLAGGHRWADLDGDGIPGVLTEEGGAWYYRANRGDGVLAEPRVVDPLPAGASLARRQLLDLAGDGRQSLTGFDGPAPGFHRRTDNRGWTELTTFEHLPVLSWDDRNLRFVDLTGDGLSDVLLTGSDGFTWHPSEGLTGFGDSVEVPRAATEERGPRLVFADAEQSVYLADMTGDGLTDLVRVRNGSVAYWPNLGHGRFGTRISMGGAPVFDHPDRFDQRRVRLSDVDGSGPADLIYLGPAEVRMWFNQAGNSFSAPETAGVGFGLDVAATTVVSDVLGKGTACLLVAEPRPDGEAGVRCLDLMAAGKPNLLVSADNGMGLRTTTRYTSSTRFSLADEAAGEPWLTRLPFPVYLVSEVEVHDTVADTKLVTSYRYRHGFYDGVEREFRGFGYVEQRDALTFTGPDGDLRQPPVLTKRWQHTGWYTEVFSRQFATEYWPGAAALTVPDTSMPPGLTTDEEREAVRALRGRVLREEIYAEEVPGKPGDPYLVTETGYGLRLLQARGGNANAVVLVVPGETLTIHTERQPVDARVTQTLTLDTDEWGNVLSIARIAYPRRRPADPAQALSHVTVTEYEVRNDTGAAWRIGTPVQTREYEVGGLIRERFSVADFAGDFEEIPYHKALSGTSRQRRLIARQRRTYYADDASAELPHGEVGSKALPYATYDQAFAPGQIGELFGERVTGTMLAGAGYLQRDGLWWRPSGRQVFDPAQFCVPTAYLDPMGARWQIGYDRHFLRQNRIGDPAGNVSQASLNYRLVRPWLLTDANGNRTGARFDALGLVIATALMGKGEGDRLDMSTVEYSPAEDDPTTKLEYDLTELPVRFHQSVRERHAVADARRQVSVTYVDGTGRVVLTKVQAEPAAGETTPRWAGTGRTIYDNKGNPVKQYEPYFSTDSGFDTDPELVHRGVTPIMGYDPLGRLVRTDFPDGTLAKVVFGPWEQEHWDRNDTVRESEWYAKRSMMPPGSAELRSAEAASAHAGTPGRSLLDTLGRVCVAIADNGAVKLKTTFERDVQGNELAVVDARGIRVREQRFTMLGQAAHVLSVDTGERFSFVDAVGKPCHGWDARNTAVRWRYDALHRPTHAYATSNGGPERLRTRYYYGEAVDGGTQHNLRTKPYAVFDGAGLVRTPESDFKGNPMVSERRLAADALSEPDWTLLADVEDPEAAISAAAGLLEPALYRTTTEYDALNRPTLVTSPDGSQTRPAYNEAGLLDKMDARIRGAGTWTPFIENVDHNARGQRTLIEYGCGARTSHSYEEDTFRLSKTDSQAADGSPLRSVVHTYDPVGNLIVADDPVQDTVFFANSMVGPERTYTYDPVYRLVEAGGREHIGQVQPTPAEPGFAQIPHANDSTAMRRYTEKYTYDAAGNIIEVAHAAPGGGWTRRHDVYHAGNRLSASSIPGDGPGDFSARYTHDANGNMTSMPQLASMDWDAENRLVHANLGGGGDAYYQYDSTGRRVRATVRAGGTTDIRVYLGQLELAVREVAGSVRLKRETLHVLDGDQRVALVETTTVDDGRTVPSPVPVRRYQLSDRLGSAIVELSDTSDVLSYEEFHPYGTSSYRSATGYAQVSLKRYRFTGKERDAETGLYYHGARYYAPWLGRWVSPDPAGFVDGPDIYAYARGNPVTYTDPTGLGAAEDRQEIVAAAQALLDARRDQLVTFTDDTPASKTKPAKDGAIAQQLNSVVNAPKDGPLPEVMSLGIARIVQRMVDKARQRRADGATGVDFSIVSLSRPTDKGASPHKQARALDIGKYAGKNLELTKPAEQVDAVIQFYADMIGDEKRGEKPVGSPFALGLPRNPRQTGEGAFSDATAKQTRLMYGWEPIIPEKHQSIVKNEDGKGTHVVTEVRDMKPVLKDKYNVEDMFFHRDELPNRGVDISRLRPESKDRFLELKKLDKTKILQFLMPDGVYHFHVQTPLTAAPPGVS